jgi:TPR repeat protein
MQVIGSFFARGMAPGSTLRGSTLLYLTMIGLTISVPAYAGFEEGLTAYKTNDFKTALNEWLPLAKQGNGEAQKYIGIMYAKGQGLPPDFKEAIAWTRKAAEQGVADAQNNLGIVYYNGQGVAEDYAAAAAWFGKAAAQGNAAGQGSLGVLYARGHGVPRLRVVAGALYVLSATNDSAGASNAAHNGLELRLSSAEQAAVEELHLEIAKPNNLLKAIEQYAKNPTEINR